MPTQTHSITFSNKTANIPRQITNASNKQITNTITHITCSTNIIMNRRISKLHASKTHHMTSSRGCKFNNLKGHDTIKNIYLEPVGLVYLIELYTLVLNANIMPPMWSGL